MLQLPPRVCEGCGAAFKPDRASRPARFCSKKCSTKAAAAKRAKGFVMSPNGYRLLYRPDHPRATKAGYIMEHRLVMEEALGRPLLTSEVVHHRNGQRADNCPENLEVMLKRSHDALTKPPPKPIHCPHCGGKIKVSGRVRRVEAL
jgi:hypothetical protein